MNKKEKAELRRTVFAFMLPALIHDIAAIETDRDARRKALIAGALRVATDAVAAMDEAERADQEAHYEAFTATDKQAAELIAVYNRTKHASWEHATPTRELISRLRAVLRRCPLDGWPERLERAAASGFLCGTTGNLSARISLEWLVRAAIIQRIDAGAFDDRADPAVQRAVQSSETALELFRRGT